MAQKAPADRYFRDMEVVHKAFFFSALAMVAVIAWMSWDDYDRDWKLYQRRFAKLERAMARSELEAVKARLDVEKISQLKADLAQEADAVKKNWVEYEKAKSDLSRAEADLYKKKMTMAFAKSDFDAGRFQYEESTRHGPDEKALTKFQKLENRHADAREAFMRQEQTVKTLAAAASSFTEREGQLQKALDRAQSESRILAAKIKKLTPSPVQMLLDAPILDFVAPSAKIQQVVLPDLQDDYNFLLVGKVDRCQTCHLGIERSSVKDADGNVVKLGYDMDNPNAPFQAQPFRAHPRPDLFVGSASKHPVEKFGCSTCHAGAGQAVSFLDAGHTPKDAAHLAEWKKKYGFKPLTHDELSDFLWDYTMYPGSMVEASCLKCHQGVVEIPEAKVLNAGRRLFEDYGCYGCHKTAGFTDLRKPGPPLTHIHEKVSQDWVKRWLKNPKVYRPTTRMPRFFDLSNTSGPEDVKRNDAEIAAVAAYLFDRAKSQTRFDAAPAVAGDAKHGKALFESVGCLGCHSLEAQEQKANTFGPDLGAIGSKIKNRDWLFTWLKDPPRYFPHTRMPSLRLTDQEASDLTAYLMSLKNPAFDGSDVPAGTVEDIDRILRDFWSSKMTQASIAEKLQNMPEREKWLAAGEKLIGQYGCFGCHDISGFEKANPIGTELTEEGSKDLDKLDFGGLHNIRHDRIAWFTQKLTDPRSFDEGKAKDRLDKLRMPNFDFTPDQIQKLVTHILSLTKDKVRSEKQKMLSPRDQIIEKGRRIVRDNNCYGCHTLDGHEGGIRAYYTEDQGLAPPILWGEGKKVQGFWLYDFLKSPTTIRPWLNVRMPTFGFTDEDATALVNYFQALDAVETVYRPKDYHRPDPQLAMSGRDLFDKLQCMKCHMVGSQAPPGRAAGDLAPDLAMAKTRLNPDWILEWLSDPAKLMPGTRMPTFFASGQSPLPDIMGGSSERQIRALRDHIQTLR